MENENKVTGPILTDEIFFRECLDDKIPEIKAVVDKYANGLADDAIHDFAEYVRRTFRDDICIPESFRVIDDKRAEEALAEAERAERHIMVSCATPFDFGKENKIDWFSNPTYNKYCEWTWQLSRHHEFDALADSYMYTGDERWAEAFREIWRSWVEQAVRPDEPTSSYATLCWRTIEAGIRMFTSWVYAAGAFLKSKSLTDRDVTDWCKSVWEHGFRLRSNPTRNNWLIMEMDGLLHVSLLYPFFALSSEWKEYSLYRLTDELEGQIHPDGFQVELTTEYHRGVVADYAGIIRFCSDCGIEMPKSMFDTLKHAAEVSVRVMRPDRGLPDINDGTLDPAKDALIDDRELYEDNPALIWCITDGKEGKEPEYTSTVFENSGIVIMRTGWSEDDIWALFDAGPFGAAHQHEDKLNFLMSSGRDYVLNEANRYAYDTSQMRAYSLTSAGHNTVLVNGMGQNRRATYSWDKKDIRNLADMKYFLGDDYDCAWGYYDEKYGEDTPARHERKVIFIKKPADGLKPYFIIIDRLISKNGAENDYETLWHIDRKNVSAGEKSVTADKLGIFASGQEWLELVRGRTGERMQGWSTTRAIQGAQYPVWTASFHVRAVNVRTVTLITPDGAPFEAVEADNDIGASDVTIIFKNGERIVFDENDFTMQ